ncbi:MAG TPA: hypothetical protein VI217_11485 [Mycobacterium sp.]|jgi:hypothetical protein
MTPISPTVSARLRRLMPAALMAATAALGGSALADPAVACAAPNTGGYDDERYEECRTSGLNERFCCSQAGGTWTKVTVYDKNGSPVSYYYMCTASAQPSPASPATNPGVIGNQPLEPAAQPPVTRVPSGVIPTLTPAAASQIG